MFVSDIARVIADCGDGIEVKADGHPIIAAQIEGNDPKVLNFISQPANVRLPEDGATNTAGGTVTTTTPEELVIPPAPADGATGSTLPSADQGDFVAPVADQPF